MALRWSAPALIRPGWGEALLLSLLAGHADEGRPVFGEGVNFYVTLTLAHRADYAFQIDRHRRSRRSDASEADVILVLLLSTEIAFHVFAAAQPSLPKLTLRE